MPRVPASLYRAPHRHRLRLILGAVGAALALGIAILALVVYLTREEDTVAVDNLLSESFTRAVALSEARGADVDLGELAPFPWDHVLVVARGTPRAAISRRLGYAWTGKLGFETGELLILLRRGAVARFFDYRGDGRFAGIERPFEEIPRDRAVFEVRDLVITPGRPG
jgi:hypothetical protein